MQYKNMDKLFANYLQEQKIITDSAFKL